MRNSTVQCSREHVIACLTRLSAVVKTSFHSADAVKATFAAYVDELQRYQPQAVTAGCLQWGRQKPGWPSLSEIIGYIENNDRSTGLPDPTKPENFLARCKRVGGYDAAWQRERHHLLEELFRDHCDGVLSDEHLVRGIEDAAKGLYPAPMPRGSAARELTNDQRLRTWRENDQLGENIRAHPERYFCAKDLLHAFANMRTKRFADHPQLAVSYYGEAA